MAEVRALGCERIRPESRQTLNRAAVEFIDEKEADRASGSDDDITMFEVVTFASPGGQACAYRDCVRFVKNTLRFPHEQITGLWTVSPRSAGQQLSQRSVGIQIAANRRNAAKSTGPTTAEASASRAATPCATGSRDSGRQSR
jgi:hypothetical protein